MFYNGEYKNSRQNNAEKLMTTTEIKQKINDYKPVHSAYYFYTLLGVCALKLNK
jgi:hypothetical protein